jgi:hypothetical protein
MKPQQIVSKVTSSAIIYSCTLLVACVLCGQVSSSSPSLELITPSVGTRGSSFAIVAKGAALKETRKVVFYDSGIHCEDIKSLNEDEIQITLRVDANCTLGAHPFRLLSDEGYSELRTLTVSPFPTVLEETDSAIQPITANTTILGTLESDDVDIYQIQANAGERISAEAVGVRLGASLLDTVLTFRDPKGRIIQRVDDTPLLNQDPAFSVLAKETGSYTVEITSAGGNADADSQYALHVGNFPRPYSLFPLGAREGTEVEMEFVSSIGDRSDISPKKMRFDSGFSGTRHVEIIANGTVCPSPIPVRLNNFDQSFVLDQSSESVPVSGFNSITDSDSNRTEVLSVPVAVHGSILGTAEVDSFRFSVHQTSTVSLEVFASRLGSLLDSLVEVHDQSGHTVCHGDDFESHDSRLVFEAKAGEVYTATIRDKRKNYGDAYNYCIELAPLRSSIMAFFPRRSKLSQSGQTIAIPRGNRTLGFIGIRRDRVDGDVTLGFMGMPEGASCDCPTILNSQFAIPAVFAADSAAATGGSLVDIRAAIEDETNGISAGGFTQVVDLVNGPADAIFQPAKVDRLGVAIISPVPYSIELIKPTVPLSIDGSIGIVVQVKRESGFDAPVDITFPLLPEWVDCDSKIRIAGDQEFGTIFLRSNQRARPGSWPIVAEATPGLADGNSKRASDATMPRGRSRLSSASSIVSVASSLHYLHISESPVRGAIAPIAAERGEIVDIECELEIEPSAPTSLVATLEGLPNRVHAESVVVSSSDKVVRFKLVIEDDAPAGNFEGIVCRLSGTSGHQSLSYCLARDSKLVIAPQGGSQKDQSGRPLSQLEALRRRRNVKGGS